VAALHAETPIAVGGGRLWTFDGKGYVDGEDDLAWRIADKLGDSWQKRHRDEILAFARDVSPAIWERPPSDRLAVANGLLDISAPSPQLSSPDPAFRSPLRLGAAYEPDAECPLIDRFLLRPSGSALAR